MAGDLVAEREVAGEGRGGLGVLRSRLHAKHSHKAHQNRDL